MNAQTVYQYDTSVNTPQFTTQELKSNVINHKLRKRGLSKQQRSKVRQLADRRNTEKITVEDQAVDVRPMSKMKFHRPAKRFQKNTNQEEIVRTMQIVNNKVREVRRNSRTRLLHSNSMDQGKIDTNYLSSGHGTNIQISQQNFESNFDDLISKRDSFEAYRKSANSDLSQLHFHNHFTKMNTKIQSPEVVEIGITSRYHRKQLSN